MESAHPPRKLLLIAYEFPPVGGGTGRVVLNMAKRLAALGYETAVMTSMFRDGETNLAREEIVEAPNGGIRVFRIPVLRRYLNYANAIEVLSFAASGAFAAPAILKKFRPDLCLAFSTIPCGTVGWEILRASGVPYFNILQGQDVPGHPELNPWLHRMAWPVTRTIWRRARRVIANSHSLAALARTAMPGLDVEVVCNSVDVERYKPLPVNPAEKRDPFRVAYVGRLVPVKRVRELVEAWALVRRQLSEPAELCMAGFGPERPALEEMARRLGIADCVRFLGRIEEEEVIALLQASDIFASASKMEGMPGAVIEAMSCGLPVVLSDIPPHRELMEGEMAGILCEGASPESIAEGLLEMLASPEKREELGRAGRKTALERYSWEAATRKLVELF